MTDKSLTLLTRIDDPYAAHTIKAALASYDIPCVLFDIETYSVIPQTGMAGIRLMVPKENLTAAQEILQDYQDNPTE